MTYENKMKFISMVCFAFSFCLLLSIPSLAVPDDVKDIQWYGNRHYKIDYATQDAVRLQKPLPVIKSPWVVLPKDSVGSCTHTAAVKVKWLRESGYNPLIVVVERMGYNHTYVALIDPDSQGYWILDNYGKVVHVNKLSGWVGSIEKAREKWR